MQRAGLAAEEAFGKIGGVPEVQVADLWPLDADDAEEMPGRNVEGSALARRHDRLADLRHAGAGVVVEFRVVGGQPTQIVDDNGRGGPARFGVGRRLV